MKKHIQEEDLALFRQHVQDAEPGHFDYVEHPRRRPPPIPRPRPPELPESQRQPHLSEAEVETHEFLQFSRPGLQRRVMADLQRGAFNVELELDLHGLQREQARLLLAEFLAECTRRRVRCALIVHGKGYRSAAQQPILKQKINYWLRLYDEVLAFCSATRRDGGTGAVYVLLRNPNKATRHP
ncbi:DNA mismatch repair protein MutS [Thiocapsa imhoffii]|uniref:DNA mismatch repair protein MutS n=1 Tax=Thiocapsa imhoffii TaxID=382777 RepID=A0A9X0WFY0_9GAMM|nr:Smr/MutS family protein [Thiocapsa imhoffii]MBK1643845.1 DNA mismatch repair protein MutS [Thiocapsa imhoffii]